MQAASDLPLDPTQREMRWRTAVAAAPTDPAGWIGLADLGLDLARFDQAAAFVRIALALDPGAAAGWRIAAVIEPDADRGQRRAERAANLTQDRDAAIYDSARRALALGAARLTERLLRAVLGRHPDQVDLLICQAGLIENRGDAGSALRLWRRALALAPGRADVLDGLGRAVGTDRRHLLRWRQRLTGRGLPVRDYRDPPPRMPTALPDGEGLPPFPPIRPDSPPLSGAAEAAFLALVAHDAAAVTGGWRDRAPDGETTTVLPLGAHVGRPFLSRNGAGTGSVAIARPLYERRVERAAPTGPRRRILFVNDMGERGGAGIGHAMIARAAAHGGQHVAMLDLSAYPPGLAAPPLARRAIAAFAPDLVICGNLHGRDGGIELLEGLIDAGLPTAVVLHDFWPLTGRCTYPGRCDKWRTGCDAACPTASAYPALAPDRIAAAHQRKRALVNRGLRLFALSADSASMAASISSRPAPVLRYPFDLDRFRPGDRTALRRALGLPIDGFLIATAAQYLDDPRKGIALLGQAVSACRDLPDLRVVAIGDGAVPIAGAIMPGFVASPDLLACYLAAADLYVGPALDEVLGRLYGEAAACGTPSIAFAVGGVPAILRDGITGLLVAPGDVAGLAAAIRRLYRDRDLTDRLGRWGRIWMENEFGFTAAFAALAQAIGASWPHLALTDAGGLLRLRDGRHPAELSIL